jgi:HEAT repeat protein
MRTASLLLLIVGLVAQRTTRGAELADIEGLTRDLRSTKSDVRARAAESLGKLGPLAAPAVRPLVAALSDNSIPVQLEALIALSEIGPAARTAIPDLVKTLQGSEVKLYVGAIDALGSIGHDAHEAAPVLEKLMEGDDPLVATSAALALARILPPGSDVLARAVPVLIAALKDKRSQVRQKAVTALGAAGSVAVPALSNAVSAHATDADAAWQAAAALELMGPPAEPAVAALSGALQSKNEKVLTHAAEALGAIGAAARSAVPAVVKLLDSHLASVRGHAAHALGNMGPAAGEAAGELTAALKARDPELRREAAQALGKIGPAARAAIPALVAALNDVDGSVTMQAAMALARMGPDAVPSLIKLLRDQNLRHLAVMILADVGPAAKPAVEALASLEVDPDVDREFRREVLLTLARLGPEAKGAVPVLMQILGDKEHTLRPGAAWALAKIGAKEAAPLLMEAVARERNTRLATVAPIALAVLVPENDAYARVALPKVIEFLGHSSNFIRVEAATAIFAMGPNAADAVPKLIDGLQDSDPTIRGSFVTALSAVGPKSAKALPAMIQALNDPVPPVRYAACHAIGRLGKEASEAIPVLEKKLLERDEILQIACAWALVKIDPRRDGLAAECLEPLTRGLHLADPQARAEAATALGDMGSAAAPVTASLEQLARDPDEAVQKAAAEALKKIRK